MVDVSPHYVIQFSDKVHLAAQQKMSRLRPFVETQQITGEKFAYDGLGTVEARKVEGRYQPVQFADIEHKRRRILPETFEVTLPVDEKDVIAMLTDPSPKYVDAVVNAMLRRTDKIIYDAMFATVYTGKNMDTTVTFANDGGLTVDATAGLTYEKILEILQNFIDNEVGNDLDVPIVFGIGGEEHTDLKSEIEFNSNDYDKNWEMSNGRLSMVEGMKTILFGKNASLPILTISSTTKDCFAAAQGAICLGIAREMKIKVQERTDLIDTMQVQVIGTMGAVRTEGKLVQKVQTTVAA